MTTIPQHRTSAGRVTRAAGRLLLGAVLASVLHFTDTAHAQSSPSPALQNYIELALKQNPDVLAERARWDQASARVDQANSNLWPHLDASMSYMNYTGGRLVQVAPNSPPVPVSKFGVVPWDNKIEAVWPVFNYAVWEGTKATKAYLAASTGAVGAKELSITYDVSEAYYNYAKATELVSIRENAVKLAKENQSSAEALFRAEKAQKNDVLRAQVAVASAKGDLLEAQNAQHLARTNFNNLLNRDYDAEIELPNVAANEVSGSKAVAVNDSTALGLQLPSFASDLRRALEARPEVMQLENASKALEGNRAVSASDYFPNVALFATWGFQEDHLKFDMNQDYLAAGVQLKWDLFNGFDTHAKVAENDAQIAELGFQKQSALDAIRLELQNARLSMENAHDRHTIALQQLQAAEENHRITKLQYEAGMVPLITMIDAETTLANARANLTVTTFDALTAEAKYRKALGIR